MNREGNTLSTVIRDGWDHGSLHVMTKRDPLHVEGAHILLIGHVTREELKRGLSETESANGFANRFLWARSQRSKYLPEGAEISDEAISDLVKRLKSAVYAAGAIQQMKRDTEAKSCGMPNTSASPIPFPACWVQSPLVLKHRFCVYR